MFKSCSSEAFTKFDFFSGIKLNVIRLCNTSLPIGEGHPVLKVTIETLTLYQFDNSNIIPT